MARKAGQLDWVGELANAHATFIPDITNAYTNAARRALKYAAARLDDCWSPVERRSHPDAGPPFPVATGVGRSDMSTRRVDLDPLLLDRLEMLGG